MGGGLTFRDTTAPGAIVAVSPSSRIVTSPSSMRMLKRRSTNRTPANNRSSSIAPGMGSSVSPCSSLGSSPSMVRNSRKGVAAAHA